METHTVQAGDMGIVAGLVAKANKRLARAGIAEIYFVKSATLRNPSAEARRRAGKAGS